MIEKSKLGFVGAGNMGKALIEGLVGQIAPGQITAADLIPEALESLDGTVAFPVIQRTSTFTLTFAIIQPLRLGR